MDYLKSEAKLESVISRESSFLSQPDLLASCSRVWGTLFPVISEAVTAKDQRGRALLHRVNVPIGLFSAVPHRRGFRHRWRRSSLRV